MESQCKRQTATVSRKEVGGKWPCVGGWLVVDRMGTGTKSSSSLELIFPTNSRLREHAQRSLALARGVEDWKRV